MPISFGVSKTCSCCRAEYEPIESGFNRNRGTADGWQNACKACKSKMTRNWRHGMTTGAIEKMYADQVGRCAICERSDEAMVLDHDHRSDNRRALLCRQCNTVLGMARDNPEILRRALDYLDRHRKNAAA